jgi:hypothetical protein
LLSTVCEAGMGSARYPLFWRRLEVLEVIASRREFTMS